MTKALTCLDVQKAAWLHVYGVPDSNPFCGVHDLLDEKEVQYALFG